MPAYQSAKDVYGDLTRPCLSVETSCLPVKITQIMLQQTADQLNSVHMILSCENVTLPRGVWKERGSSKH